MFKMIGAVVVYGFALYGVVRASERLGRVLDRPSRPEAGAGSSRPGGGREANGAI